VSPFSVPPTIDGGAGSDSLFGCAGNDILFGNTGVDSMWGDDGNDKFQAADGAVDWLRGGSGTDSAVFPDDGDSSRDANDGIPDEDIENL
jgi:Ca2+-binding RTX toxin-like protein